MQHHFNIEIAKKFGINVAIFLDNMYFWIQKNIANEQNFHDDNYWTYNTIEAYTIIFPYWTNKQMRKVLDDCVKYGLVNIGNHNKKKYDRTAWYSLTEYGAKLLNLNICPKGRMDLPKRANGFAQKGEPIPDTYTDTYTDREKPAPKRARTPLSENFKPDEQQQQLLEKTSTKVQLDPDVLLAKFRNLHKRTNKMSSDWQAELENFLLNERPNPFTNVVLKSVPSYSIPNQNNVTQGRYRDFTEERLAREKVEHEEKLRAQNK